MFFLRVRVMLHGSVLLDTGSIYIVDKPYVVALKYHLYNCFKV